MALVEGKYLAPFSSKPLHEQRLRAYQDKLLQVDWRNRSVLLRKIVKKWSFDLSCVSDLYPDVVVNILQRALRGKGQVCILKDNDQREEAGLMRTHLVQLERQVRRISDETGQKDLYVGFPFICGPLGLDRGIRAPLILFPAVLERLSDGRPAGWYISFDESNPAIVNRALIATLHKVGGIDLRHGFQDRVDKIIECMANDRDYTYSSFFEQLWSELGASGVHLCNKQSTDYSIQPLKAMTADTAPWTDCPSLELEYTAILGSFPQGSDAIFHDYETLINIAEEGSSLGIVGELIDAPDSDATNATLEHHGHSISLDEIPDHEKNNALPSDGSQEEVIAEAQTARCTVVRGPPGTGKSQTIANMVTNALAKGERVLVVCQKRAALDVVKQRLDTEGLGETVALVHDVRADRASLYAQLATRMQKTSYYSSASVAIELENVSTQIDHTIAEINDIVKPLWEEYFGGYRLQHIYALAEEGYVTRLDPSLFKSFTKSDLEAFSQKLPFVQRGFLSFGISTYPLCGRSSFAQLDANSRFKFESALDDAIQHATEDTYCAGDLDVQTSLLNTITDYHALENSFLRFLSSKWRRANRAIARTMLDHRGDSRFETVDQLYSSAVQGDVLLKAVSNLQPWLSRQSHSKLIAEAADPVRLIGCLKGLRECCKDFDKIQEYDQAVESLIPIYRNIFNALVEHYSEEDDWTKVLQKEAFKHWIMMIEGSKPQLRGEPFLRYKGLQTNLGLLLDRRRALFKKKLAYEILEHASTPVLPPELANTRKNPKTLWNNLHHEFTKQRNIKPLRLIMEKYNFEMGQVCPCWLLSPETLSEIFPMKDEMFDLVIFDEASQLAVERGLPALYRCKRAVIAGDEKQLRPFDLFRIKDEEDDNADDLVSEESLLELAKRRYEPKYLAWHYRSESQELIDFSNHAFYNGALQIAPNVKRSAGSPPIEFIRCNGTWVGRTNAIEAELIVDKIADLLDSTYEYEKPPSIGVITFNEAQRDEIQTQIDARCESDPLFARSYALVTDPKLKLEDQLFIKNIENVQGDEREVIIFSIGYAPDPATGKLSMIFGSLNQEGGENRLNVAITRAKKRVIVVASFDPDNMHVDEAKNLGPKRLKQYLQYARAVSCSNVGEVKRILEELDKEAAKTRYEADRPDIYDSVFEKQVCDALRSFGYTVDTQVGFSGYCIDLAIVNPRDPGQYILGIECDGAMFHSARSARERDVTRQRFLESRGWTIERIWSRNWWRNSQGEINRIAQRVERFTGWNPEQGAEPLHAEPVKRHQR